MQQMVSLRSVVVLGWIALSSACGDASRPSGWQRETPSVDVDATESALGYGWDRPITAENFDEAAETKLGDAPQAIAGETLRAIVTDANVRIRADGAPCSTCHAWASSTDRASFCARVTAFLAQPISKGDGTDPPNAKPPILRSLLSSWQDASCPE
jgi:hypothetical protein